MAGDATWTATYHVVDTPRACDRNLGEGGKAVYLDAQVGAGLDVGGFDRRRGVVVEHRDIGYAHLRAERRGGGGTEGKRDDARGHDDGDSQCRMCDGVIDVRGQVVHE